MTDSYRTLLKAADDEFIVQKSRFIGCAAPCESEEDAQSFLHAVKDRFHDASHHCYAYIIGQNMGIIRYSDDGEPGGTAGLPILNLIRAEKLVNCCVVVVRYFGGILLGTGGLSRAYAKGCRIALDAAGAVTMEPTSHDLCLIPYPMWDRLRHMLSQERVQIRDLSFDEAVSFTLLTLSADRERILQKLDNLASGQAEHLFDNETFEAWPVTQSPEQSGPCP